MLNACYPSVFRARKDIDVTVKDRIAFKFNNKHLQLSENEEDG